MKKYVVISIALSVVSLYASDQKSKGLWTQTTGALSAIPKPVRYIGGGALAGFGGSVLASQIASSRLTWITTGAGLGAYAYYKADDFALGVQRYRLALNVAMNMQCVENNMRQKKVPTASIVEAYAHIKPEDALEALANLARQYPASKAGKSTAAPVEPPVASGIAQVSSVSSVPSGSTVTGVLVVNEHFGTSDSTQSKNSSTQKSN